MHYFVWSLEFMVPNCVVQEVVLIPKRHASNTDVSVVRDWIVADLPKWTWAKINSRIYLGSTLTNDLLSKHSIFLKGELFWKGDFSKVV